MPLARPPARPSPSTGVPPPGDYTAMAVRRGLTLLALMAALLVAGALLPVREWAAELLGLVRQAGPVGVVLYAAAFVPAALLLLPAAPLALGAGYAFGPVLGTLVAALGAALGALAAFEAGRHVGGDALGRLLRRSRRVAPFARALGHAGFEVVLWLRLSPLVPFYLLNYAFGATGMRTRDFAAATALALLPGCALAAGLGSLLAIPDEAAFGMSGHRWAVLAAAVLLTLVSATAARLRLPRALASAPAAARTPPRDRPSPGVTGTPP